MAGRLRTILREPTPLRFILLRILAKRFDFLSYTAKLDYSVLDRPQYGHCLLHAARLARKLGHQRITAIEFGVAGGNGLIALERHAAYTREETGVETVIYGFDAGTGMPAPVDHRDMPYLWQAGNFAGNVEALKRRLRAARLIIGPVEKTVLGFCAREDVPPIGFIAFDLDYYSSTVAALTLFEAPERYFLPRVACYFDDVVGDVDWAYNEFAGELLAIREFNQRQDRLKIARVRGLRYFGARWPQLWHEQVYVAHLFRHPEYGRPISDLRQLPLSADDDPQHAA